jgi:xylulose-5-phosphate/fructose-6-phosphate phosphoketolase
MVVMNGVSRFHLVLEALRRSHREPDGATGLITWCLNQLNRHAVHVVEQLEDLPEIRDWTWGAPLPPP